MPSTRPRNGVRTTGEDAAGETALPSSFAFHICLTDMRAISV
jgi:hypothetical protein